MSKFNVYSYIGQLVQAARNEAEKTLEEVAEEAGITVERLVQIEDGIPHVHPDELEDYLQVCFILSISLDEVVDMLRSQQNVAFEIPQTNEISDADQADMGNQEVLFESNRRIRFCCEGKRNWWTVKVQSQRGKRHYTLMSYRFPKVHLSVSSPYISWQNLNCCGGWAFDESYLLTAVQKKRKLYAGCSISIHPRYSGDTLESAREQLDKICTHLPEDCLAGEEKSLNINFFNFYICRKGALKDYFDLEQVFEDYKRLMVPLSKDVQEEVKGYCEYELHQFAEKIPFDYGCAQTPAECITTGLLLGYPLGSTASILCDYN